MAALAWSANMAALEIHAPMARGDDIESPTMCVFDLDPGPRTGIPECAEVALDIREVLDNLAGLECLAKTSGSKGLQLYVPLNTHAHPRALLRVRPGRGPGAREAPPEAGDVDDGQGGPPRQGLHRLEPEQPPQDDRRRVLAPGPAAPDGVHPGDVGRGRGRRPAASDLAFEAADVLARVDEHGDLFADDPQGEAEAPEAERLAVSPAAWPRRSGRVDELELDVVGIAEDERSRTESAL